MLDKFSSERRKLILAAGGIAGSLALAALGIDYSTSSGNSTLQAAGKRRVTLEDIRGLEGVGSVYMHKGSIPDVICIACPHPLIYGETDMGLKQTDYLMHLKNICLSLVGEYGVKSIMIDGIKQPKFENGHFTFPENRTPSSRKFYDTIEDMLNKAKMGHVFNAEKPDNMKRINAEIAPLRVMYSSFMDEVTAAMNQLVDQNKDMFRTEQGIKAFSMLADELYSKIRHDYEFEKNDILTYDKLKRMYDLIVVEREKKVVETAFECKNRNIDPLIAIYGTGHSVSLPNTLEAKGLNHVSIMPKGVHELPVDAGPEGMRSLFLLPPVRPYLKIDDLFFEGKPIMVQLESAFA